MPLILPKMLVSTLETATHIHAKTDCSLLAYAAFLTRLYKHPRTCCFWGAINIDVHCRHQATKKTTRGHRERKSWRERKIKGKEKEHPPKTLQKCCQ